MKPTAETRHGDTMNPIYKCGFESSPSKHFMKCPYLSVSQMNASLLLFAEADQHADYEGKHENGKSTGEHEEEPSAPDYSM